MSSKQQDPKGNLEAEGLPVEGETQDPPEENESPLAISSTRKSATGSGTIKVNG